MSPISFVACANNNYDLFWLEDRPLNLGWIAEEIMWSVFYLNQSESIWPMLIVRQLITAFSQVLGIQREQEND